MTKLTMLGIVSEWWQWSDHDLADFRAWAAINREEAIAWLRQEAESALAQHDAGFACVEDWIAHGRRKHA